MMLIARFAAELLRAARYYAHDAAVTRLRAVITPEAMLFTIRALIIAATRHAARV